MLRRLDLKAPWRSLDQGFWPDDLPLGCRTVIYGHNGSGKSTLSELLLGLAEGTSSAAVVWERDDMRRTTVNAGGASPSPSMAVFTRKWVDANLSAFLDGASASAIVTLGREAIDAKEEEARLVNERVIVKTCGSACHATFCWRPDSSGRSTSLPRSKVAPARTRATRCGALTARQRRCADSMSLNAIAMPAAREPGPLVTR